MQEHEGSHSVVSHASSGRRSFTRFPPLSIDVSSDLGLLHVVDALPLTHPGLVRGPCSPSPQASRAWRASHHVKIVMYPFSMISPPKIAGKGTPRLSAMGGRAGCNPDSPLRLTTKCRLPPRDFKNIPHFDPPQAPCLARGPDRAHAWIILSYLI